MPDAQAAHEHTLTAMLPALAGANLIYGMGMLDSGMTWDYAQLLMQNETVGMILKSIQGFPVTDEHFALDVVKDVGPGGEFITTTIPLPICGSSHSPGCLTGVTVIPGKPTALRQLRIKLMPEPLTS